MFAVELTSGLSLNYCVVLTWVFKTFHVRRGFEFVYV